MKLNLVLALGLLLASTSVFSKSGETGQNASSGLSCKEQAHGCGPCEAKCIQQNGGEGGKRPGFEAIPSARRPSGKSRAVKR